MGLTGLAHQAAQAGSLRRVASTAAAVLPAAARCSSGVEPSRAARARRAEPGRNRPGFSAQAQTALVQIEHRRPRRRRPGRLAGAEGRRCGRHGRGRRRRRHRRGQARWDPGSAAQDLRRRRRPTGLTVASRRAARRPRRGRRGAVRRPVGPGGKKAAGQQNARRWWFPRLWSTRLRSRRRDTAVAAGSAGDHSGQSPAATRHRRRPSPGSLPTALRSPAARRDRPGGRSRDSDHAGQGQPEAQEGQRERGTTATADAQTTVPDPVPSVPGGTTRRRVRATRDPVPVTQDLPGNGNHNGWVDGVPGAATSWRPWHWKPSQSPPGAADSTCGVHGL